MKYIEKLSTSDLEREKIQEEYNKQGKTVSSPKEKVFAKFTEVNVGNDKIQKKYYVITNNNCLYDPYGIDSHRERTLRTQLKSVSKQTFDYYMMYLQSRNLLYLTRANRSFING